MNGLVLSMVLHLGHTWFSFWQNKTCSLHNLISAWFSIIVCLGYFTVNTGIYQAVYGTSVKFPYEPYILEFLFFLIFMWPFRNFKSKDIAITDMPLLKSKKIRTIFKFLLLVYSLYFLLLLRVDLYVFSHSIGEAYDSAHYDGKTLYPYSNLESKIDWICGSLYNWTSPIILIYALSGIINKKNGWSRNFNFLCILFVVIIFFLSCVSTGRRGGTFFFIVRMIFVFLPFWNQIPKRIKATALSSLPWVILLFFLYAVSMTVYRVQDSTETPFASVLRYLGESYPHLGNAFWDKVLFHPMGARLYPFAINVTSVIENANSLGEQHQIWEVITGVPILNYKTIYGDFYVDFGPYIPFLFVFVYSLLLKIFTSKGQVKFAAYPVLYYYIAMAATAPLWFSMRELSGVLNLLIAIVLYFVIKAIKR